MTYNNIAKILYLFGIDFDWGAIIQLIKQDFSHQKKKRKIYLTFEKSLNLMKNLPVILEYKKKILQKFLFQEELFKFFHQRIFFYDIYDFWNTKDITCVKAFLQINYYSLDHNWMQLYKKCKEKTIIYLKYKFLLNYFILFTSQYRNRKKWERWKKWWLNLSEQPKIYIHNILQLVDKNFFFFSFYYSYQEEKKIFFDKILNTIRKKEIFFFKNYESLTIDYIQNYVYKTKWDNKQFDTEIFFEKNFFFLEKFFKKKTKKKILLDNIFNYVLLYSLYKDYTWTRYVSIQIFEIIKINKKYKNSIESYDYPTELVFSSSYNYSNINFLKQKLLKKTLTTIINCKFYMKLVNSFFFLNISFYTFIIFSWNQNNKWKNIKKIFSSKEKTTEIFYYNNIINYYFNKKKKYFFFKKNNFSKKYKKWYSFFKIWLRVPKGFEYLAKNFDDPRYTLERNDPNYPLIPI